MPGEPGDPAENLHRLDIQVRPLRSPGNDQVIHFIVQ